jgi:hypothetical protein
MRKKARVEWQRLWDTYNKPDITYPLYVYDMNEDHYQQLSTDFVRVVIGDRGPYIEIHPDQMCLECIYIPENQKWRVDSAKWKDKVYYLEYRTNITGAMVYLQKRCVKYADYKVNMYYVSPWDVVKKDSHIAIGGLPPSEYYLARKK